MIDFEVADGCATIQLNRPPVNAINDAWLARFHMILNELEVRDDIRLMHVKSELKSFCAGMDLERIKTLFEMEDGSSAMVGDVSEFQRLFARIEAAPFVSLAEIAGTALGGGLELALSCDLRVASTKAKLGLPETGLGLIPGAGGTQRLTRLCGRGTAGRVILSAEILSGSAAAELGIVQWAIEPGLLEAGVRDIITRITRLAPAAVREAKMLIAAAGDPERDGYFEEREADRRLFAHEDTRGRIGAFLAGSR
uniref:Enoyl-CoA hydratase n=1 Tax=Sphingomonas sp. JE1 TaxID=1628059 RepID=A0A0D5A091_9SPHN|nr:MULTISPECIES: enoyl-CoA hydratase/isomerase family protein [unclassified Sphingomonas]AJW29598.1 Enoyl-CoA hydratase [Sphingomonas sp. JE1]